MGWREKEQAKLLGKRVLVVGAGGIGCELLKNIVLAGFKDIHVIDLDTIDVSNLNRQFLFRREHVGKSKAEVATAAVRDLVPGVSITFDHDSIFSEKFNLTFFKQFVLVMNALDNKAARNHVNRMCLAGRIPLVESGSSGYLGQVSVIIRGETECYECVAKPAQKTFPGCTIRNTPSEHIHCTVWSKHLFNQLFGELDIDDDVSPDINDENNKDAPVDVSMEVDGSNKKNGESSANGHNNGNGAEDSVVESDEEKQPSTRQWAESVQYDADKLFTKLFYDDINYLLKMSNLWKERRPPKPLRIENLEEVGTGGSGEKKASDDISKVWSGYQCGLVFRETVAALFARKAALPPDGILIWDKDDEDAMRFVAACANIRAMIFGIPTKTLFEIKSMAGNIIPAIATTNAMVAGMVVVEALKIIDGATDKLRTTFIRQIPNPRGKILVDQDPPQPNPKCFVCADKRECFVKLNPHAMTVRLLQDKVLKGALHMLAPDVMDAAGRVILSSEEGETDPEVLEKKLADMKIGDGAILECDDFMQNLDLKVIVQAVDKLQADEFEIAQDSGSTEEEAQKAAAEEDEESRKRSRKSAAPEPEDFSAEDEQQSAKRAKLDEEMANGIAAQ